ncbi:MAG: VWA domain-containing protein [Candidatus Uhrbacteria bacterium]|nr:VWA domain-containing protein [Candidatus Uhrbacteria bacterium]
MSKTIALLVDNSGSMGYYEFIEYAKTDAATFVNIMHKNDRCAVVGFNQNATVVQPLTVLTNQSVTDGICRKILAMSSDGNTNIGDAIVKANGQGVTSMVLLTDGEWNVPPDPLTVLPAYPIYTIALGNSAGINTMQTIAQRTGGTYHFAPGYRDLQRVYNEIAQDSTIADTITNELESVNAYDYREVTVAFSPDIDSGKLAVNWDDVNVTYTPGTPTGNQVNISITDPSGQAYAASPVFTAPAGVVFDIPNPAPGIWTVGCWYAGQSGGRPLNCVWGGFEPYGTAKIDLKTKDTLLTIGEPAGIDLEFSDAGGPITNASIRITIESPRMTIAEAVEMNAGELKEVAIETDHDDKIDENLARAAAFERQTGRSYVPVSRMPLHAIASGNGLYHIDLPQANLAGHVTLHIVAEGISQKTGSPVKRTRHITMTVT